MFTSDCPAWANDFNIRQFDEPVERAELIRHINIARREVHRVLAGRQKAPDVSELVDWSGAAYPLPRLGVLARGRDAFVRHRPVVRAPTRRFSRKAPDPEPRRDPPPGAGVGLIDFSHAESPETRPPGRLLGPGEGGSGEVAGCSWMLICPHTGRSDIGKTVVPGVGSFLGTGGLGSFGLFLDHVGSYVPIRLVKLSEIQREVEEIIGNSEPDGAAVPVGFRDDDEAPAGLVDLKKLAGGDGDLTPRGDDRNDGWKHAVRRPEKAADKLETPAPPL